MNRHTILKSLAVLAIFAISPALASADTIHWPQFTPIEPPLPFPEDPFVGADGVERSIRDYHGTPVIINLWATWCAPCVREMPDLNALAATLKDDGIIVLALSQDRGDPAKVGQFLADHALDNLAPWRDERGRIMRKLGINALPTTVFVNAAGAEIGRVQGTAEWDTPEIAAIIRVLFSTRGDGDG